MSWPVDNTFTDWMLSVDKHLHAMCGLTHLDLADWRYRDAYNDGVDPREAAEEVLTEEGFPFDES